MFRRLLILVLLAVIGLCTIPACSTPNENTVVVANQNIPASIDIATYYASVRQVPNILYLDIPLSTMSGDYQVLNGGYAAFDKYVNQPFKSYMAGKTILYVVLTYGIPVKAVVNPGSTSLYCMDNALAGDFAFNEFFCKPYQFSNCYGQYIVTRLDGPTPEIAKSLVDRAIAGEASWSKGKCYFDAGGPYPTWDTRIQTAYQDSISLGYDSVLDTSSALMQSFPDCQFYYGWYTGYFTGNFAWKPGGVGIHVHSGSAYNMRDTRFWVPGLLASGAACTAGAVNEPYLDYYVHPDHFVKSFLRGDNFGEAFYKSIPSLRWMMVAVGDPLYNPTNPNRPDPVDTIAPTAPSAPLSNFSSATNSPRPTLSWRPAIDDWNLKTYHMYIGQSSGKYNLFDSDIGVTRVWTVPMDLSDGTYYTALYAEDTAGHRSPLSPEGVIIVDTVPPIVSSISTKGGKVSWRTNELSQGHLEYLDGSTKYGSGDWNTRWAITSKIFPCYIVARDRAYNVTRVFVSR